MTERMLVVLDEGASDEAPPGWRQAAPEHRIVACPPDRAPALLEQAAEAKPLADVVAGGQLVPVALRLAEQHPDAVRSVLLVGPDPEGDGRASREWFAAYGNRVASAREAGVEVEVLPHGPAGAPLSEPRVAAAVAATLDRLPAVRRPDW
ncbi:hypothetical protein CU254_15805 [Amycolatopsis sp. AA4]|uniref:hypothetical protein n=1 Tax=Actinomycetes TaxID=1760 RepID=UPI0001B56AC9|nr:MULTISPECIES: hypothetical protein [Actinomycetes]ATY11765.1 hypothetical protein CU254_15805 [Amycolatopsis sp. AA4]